MKVSTLYSESVHVALRFFLNYYRKKLNFQTVIMFVIMKGHTCAYKLFKNIRNDVQTRGKGKIIRLYITTLKLYFDNTCISVEWLISK